MTATITQAETYSAQRLNGSQPIVTRSHFAAAGVSSDGDNINGPSLVRVPDWIGPDDRPDPHANYYLYFAHHHANYIRMAWAQTITGPYTLFNTGTASDQTLKGSVTPGDGVLDLNLGGTHHLIEIPNRASSGTFTQITGHIASPDVRVDDVNQRIAMYFHGQHKGGQDTFVATSSDGLNFNTPCDGGQAGHGILDVTPGHFYFSTFEVAGRSFAYSNEAELYRGPATTSLGDAATLANAHEEGGLWNPGGSPNSTAHHWQKLGTWANPIENLYKNVLLEGGNDPRHFAVHHNADTDPDRIYIAYSARNDAPESILLSVVDLTGLTDAQRQDPANWALLDLDANTPGNQFQLTLLEPQENWEGGDLPITTSRDGRAIGVRELRDPFIFEDLDGSLYLFYIGRGEEGIGVASLTIPKPASLALPGVGGVDAGGDS